MPLQAIQHQHSYYVYFICNRYNSKKKTTARKKALQSARLHVHIFNRANKAFLHSVTLFFTISQLILDTYFSFKIIRLLSIAEKKSVIFFCQSYTFFVQFTHLLLEYLKKIVFINSRVSFFRTRKTYSRLIEKESHLK